MFNQNTQQKQQKLQPALPGNYFLPTENYSPLHPPPPSLPRETSSQGAKPVWMAPVYYAAQE